MDCYKCGDEIDTDFARSKRIPLIYGKTLCYKCWKEGFTKKENIGIKMRRLREKGIIK